MGLRTSAKLLSNALSQHWVLDLGEGLDRSWSRIRAGVGTSQSRSRGRVGSELGSGSTVTRRAPHSHRTGDDADESLALWGTNREPSRGVCEVNRSFPAVTTMGRTTKTVGRDKRTG